MSTRVRITYVEGATPVPLDRYPMRLFAPGRPRTKGSLRHQGRGHMVEQVAGSGLWRRLIAEKLAFTLGQEQGQDGPVRKYLPYVGPVSARAVFWFAGRVEGGDPYPVGRRYGDLDKLARNIGDAMTDAGVIADDSLIVGWELEKLWAYGDGLVEGVRLDVSAVRT